MHQVHVSAIILLFVLGYYHWLDVLVLFGAISFLGCDLLCGGAVTLVLAMLAG